MPASSSTSATSFKSCLLLSVLLHATSLAGIAWLESSPPWAPALAGGGGSGTILVELTAWPADSTEPGPRRPEPAAERLPAPDLAPLQVAPAPAEPVRESMPAMALLPLTIELSREALAELPPAAAIVPSSDTAAREEDVEAPRLERAAQEDPTFPAPELPAAEALAGGAAGGPGTSAPGMDDPEALRPVYPLSCRRQRHQGETLLRVLIAADGKAQEVKVLRSAGCPDLDRAAVEAVSRARYRPAVRWGRTVACSIEQPIRFELRS